MHENVLREIELEKLEEQQRMQDSHQSNSLLKEEEDCEVCQYGSSRVLSPEEAEARKQDIKSCSSNKSDE